jgi:hypothetical protein
MIKTFFEYYKEDKMKNIRLLILSIVFGIFTLNAIAQVQKTDESTKSNNGVVKQATKKRLNMFDPKAEVKVTPPEKRKNRPTPPNSAKRVVS